MKLKITCKQLQRILIITIVSCLLATPVAAAVENGKIYVSETNQIKEWPQAEDIFSETAVLMEMQTGTILYNKGMDELRYPASITKIMTAYLLLENKKSTEEIEFTEDGVKEVYAGSANIKMQVGEKLTVEQCAYAILLASANEVSTQAAISVSGSVEAFVQLMNNTAKELGCKNTNFNNANGLPDEHHYTTAYDMALIARAAIQNEEFCKITGTQNYTIPPTNKTSTPRNLSSHHAMLMPGEYYYEGVFGGKTGNTDAAKSTLVTFAEKNKMKFICVVLRAEGGQVVADTKKLLDYGYDNFVDLSVSTVEQGYVVVPKKVKESDLDFVQENIADGIQYTYTYKEHPVGIVQISNEELALRQQEEDIEETQAKKKETDKEGTIQEQEKKLLQEEKIAKANIQVKRTQRIVIFVLSGMIFVMVVLLVIVVVKKKKDNKKDS